jgi:hypothetical protein
MVRQWVGPNAAGLTLLAIAVLAEALVQDWLLASEYQVEPFDWEVYVGRWRLHRTVSRPACGMIRTPRERAGSVATSRRRRLAPLAPRDPVEAPIPHGGG